MIGEIQLTEDQKLERNGKIDLIKAPKKINLLKITQTTYLKPLIKI